MLGPLTISRLHFSRFLFLQPHLTQSPTPTPFKLTPKTPLSLLLPQGVAFADDTAEAHAVPHAGDYHFRANPGAEKHLNDPAAIAALQAAAQVRRSECS